MRECKAVQGVSASDRGGGKPVTECRTRREGRCGISFQPQGLVGRGKLVTKVNEITEFYNDECKSGQTREAFRVCGHMRWRAEACRVPCACV
ncbi:hypothetical protein E2C01_044284 [Portunus trituberculatus]|uniref:Uncharacterized protein n=1 Tax=Portunus trituberculatus TaxID=210409 RepID=A0A5B7FY04_PORTR|nr:hypothetical protein [Portunus trituberculatus]